MSDFRMPSARLRKSLGKAQKTYSQEIHLADGFLSARGIDLLTATKWGLGVVAYPLPSHEVFQGRLCVPYFNAAGEVLALEFRCMKDHECKPAGCGKYLQPLNQTQFLFNLSAVDESAHTLHVCEGALDTIVHHSVFGEPVVGASGIDKWQPHWVAHFRGWERVLLWPDGDKAGRDMVRFWGKRITCEVVTLPNGYDVTKLVVEHGPEGLRKLVGEDDDTI